MRARGAKATDIVVLVVAADDGVMPQTVEAINHARAAKVPIIVAINKIDKQSANPNRVRTELLQHEIVVESMGGDTLEVEVSALKGTNLDKLLETILLQAEVLDLKANPDREASGIVVEAQLDKGRGPVATVLVQRGTLQSRRYLRRRLRLGPGARARQRQGRADQGSRAFGAGRSAGSRIRRRKQATSSTSSRTKRGPARSPIIATASGARRAARPSARASLEQMMSQLKEGGAQGIPGPGQGRRAGLGGSDRPGAGKARQRRDPARASSIMGSAASANRTSSLRRPRVRWCSASMSAPMARRATRPSAQGIEIRYYNIIYDLVDDIKTGDVRPAGAGHCARPSSAMREILEIFNITKVGKVAGCQVTEGSVQRGAKVRLIRDNVVIHEGTLSTLKRFKDEVQAKCRSARNAAWPSRTTRTCAPATSSSASASRRCSGRWIIARHLATSGAAACTSLCVTKLRRCRNHRSIADANLRPANLIRHALADDLPARRDGRSRARALAASSVHRSRDVADLRIATAYVRPLAEGKSDALSGA